VLPDATVTPSPETNPEVDEAPMKRRTPHRGRRPFGEHRPTDSPFTRPRPYDDPFGARRPSEDELRRTSTEPPMQQPPKKRMPPPAAPADNTAVHTPRVEPHEMPVAEYTGRKLKKKVKKLRAEPETPRIIDDEPMSDTARRRYLNSEEF
jgi:hypothetical protein